MEPVTIAAGALITQVVKSGYEKWVEGQTESLALTDEAKDVLVTMQSDSSRTMACSVELAFLGSASFRVDRCLRDGMFEPTVTNRVMAELEAKGLVVIEYDGSDSGDLVKLTHFGWILNPETGKADKVG